MLNKILFPNYVEPVMEDSLSFLQGLGFPVRPGQINASILREAQEWGSDEKTVSWAPMIKNPGGRDPN